MKSIGTTKEGNFLVEMSRDEWITFVRLGEAVEGKADGWSIRETFFTSTIDLSSVFDTMRVLSSLHYRVNDLDGIIKEIRKLLNKSS